MSCGEKAIQLALSAADLQKSLRFAARKLAVLILPFNLMSLTAKLFYETEKLQNLVVKQ